jgi:hypothetical protein
MGSALVKGDMRIPVAIAGLRREADANAVTQMPATAV